MKQQNDIIHEFDVYLAKIKAVSPKARGNYLSWARFLMKTHDLMGIRTEEDVTHILDKERQLMKEPSRKIYTKDRDFGNFRSTLNRFLPFVQCYICKTLAKKKMISMDEMIDMIGTQDTAVHAHAMNDALRIIVFEQNYTLTDEQKQRLKENISKFDTSTQYNLVFHPNSNATIHNH